MGSEMGWEENERPRHKVNNPAPVRHDTKYLRRWKRRVHEVDDLGTHLPHSTEPALQNGGEKHQLKVVYPNHVTGSEESEASL